MFVSWPLGPTDKIYTQKAGIIHIYISYEEFSSEKRPAHQINTSDTP